LDGANKLNKIKRHFMVKKREKKIKHTLEIYFWKKMCELNIKGKVAAAISVNIT